MGDSVAEHQTSNNIEDSNKHKGTTQHENSNLQQPRQDRRDRQQSDEPGAEVGAR